MLSWIARGTLIACKVYDYFCNACFCIVQAIKFLQIAHFPLGVDEMTADMQWLLTYIDGTTGCFDDFV